MSGPIWSRPVKRPCGLYFVNTKGRVAVLLVDEPTNYPCIRLHWDADANTSVVCLGDGCKACGVLEAPRDYCYAPCLHFAKNQGRWYHAILPIGDPSFGLATTDYRGAAIWVGPSRDPADRKRVISYGTVREQLAPLPQVVKSFDIRPNLLRRWGMFKEADLVGCERMDADQAALEKTGTDDSDLGMGPRSGPSLFTGGNDNGATE